MQMKISFADVPNGRRERRLLDNIDVLLSKLGDIEYVAGLGVTKRPKDTIIVNVGSEVTVDDLYNLKENLDVDTEIRLV